MMELADVADSKSAGLIPRVGSSPTSGTMKTPDNIWGFRILHNQKYTKKYTLILMDISTFLFLHGIYATNIVVRAVLVAA